MNKEKQCLHTKITAPKVYKYIFGAVISVCGQYFSFFFNFGNAKAAE